MHLVKELLVSPEVIADIYTERSVYFQLEDYFPVNSYAVLRSELNDKNTALARHAGDGIWSLASNKLKVGSTIPRDANQSAFADALLNENILVNAAIGAAGTGKSTIAAAYACEQHLKSKKKILLCKPTVMVGAGKAFGPIPGDIQEKYAPYLASFEIVFKKLLGGDKAGPYIESMKARGDLQFIPLELARGCTYENCTFILDEAQNIGWHEMNTLMSRLGEGSKMLVLGDLSQVDIRMSSDRTGLGTLVASAPFNDSEITSVVELETQYRSPICQLATEIDRWVKTER